MLRFLSFLLVVVSGVMVLLAGCATTGSAGGPADEAAIRTIFDNYKLSAETGNIDLRLSLWDEKGIQLRPDGASQDKPAIAERIRKGWPTVTTQVTIDVQEVVVAGGWGYARGLYTSRSTPKTGGAATLVDIKFLTVCRKQPDGSWKIYRDCFNSNVPPK